MVSDVKQKQTPKDLWDNSHPSIPYFPYCFLWSASILCQHIFDNQTSGFRLITTAACTLPFFNVHYTNAFHLIQLSDYVIFNISSVHVCMRNMSAAGLLSDGDQIVCDRGGSSWKTRSRNRILTFNSE
jgi:hypothetical protein